MWDNVMESTASNVYYTKFTPQTAFTHSRESHRDNVMGNIRVEKVERSFVKCFLWYFSKSDVSNERSHDHAIVELLIH
jgi:hypothetical protein